MIELYLAVGISLIVTVLVVRDRTSFKLSRLRSEVMALRSEEKRTAEVLTEVEVFISRIADGILRADRRELQLEKETERLDVVLKELKELLQGDEEEEPLTMQLPAADEDSEASIEEQT